MPTSLLWSVSLVMLAKKGLQFPCSWAKPCPLPTSPLVFLRVHRPLIGLSVSMLSLGSTPSPLVYNLWHYILPIVQNKHHICTPPGSGSSPPFHSSWEIISLGWTAVQATFNYDEQLVALLQSAQLSWPSVPSNGAPSTPTLKMTQQTLCCLSTSHQPPFLSLFLFQT